MRPQWIIGLLFSFGAAIGHCAVLPFADLVLLSTNCAWAVIFSQVLAITILKEKFVMRYDLPALVLIITGCLTIVFNANYEVIEYSKETIMDLLFNNLNLSIYIVLLFIYILTKFFDCWFQKKLI